MTQFLSQPIFASVDSGRNNVDNGRSHLHGVIVDIGGRNGPLSWTSEEIGRLCMDNRRTTSFATNYPSTLKAIADTLSLNDSPIMYFPLGMRYKSILSKIQRLGQQMSTLPCQTGSMKIATSVKLKPVPDETVGRLGQVRLMKKADGRHYLLGGTPSQRAAAEKWCAQFTPFVKFDEPALQELWLVTVLRLQLRKFGFGKKCGRKEFFCRRQTGSRELGSVVAVYSRLGVSKLWIDQQRTRA